MSHDAYSTSQLNNTLSEYHSNTPIIPHKSIASSELKRLYAREISFEVCMHTRKGSTCINNRTKSVLWPKEGNSCVWHVQQPSLHQECRPPCLVTHETPSRDTIPAEYDAAIQLMLKAHFSESKIDEIFFKNLNDWVSGCENWPIDSNVL